jgi:hypothetical protein
LVNSQQNPAKFPPTLHPALPFQEITASWQNLTDFPEVLRKRVNLHLPILSADTRFTG